MVKRATMLVRWRCYLVESLAEMEKQPCKGASTREQCTSNCGLLCCGGKSAKRLNSKNAIVLSRKDAVEQKRTVDRAGSMLIPAGNAFVQQTRLWFIDTRYNPVKICCCPIKNQICQAIGLSHRDAVKAIKIQLNLMKWGQGQWYAVKASDMQSRLVICGQGSQKAVKTAVMRSKLLIFVEVADIWLNLSICGQNHWLSWWR